MFTHVRFKGSLALAVAIVGAVVLVAGAAASPAPTVAFSSSHDGASAGWTDGKGSPIELTLGSSSGSFAVIKLNHAHGDAVSELSEPTFETDNYNAGSPRFYITLSDGNTLWGYPSQSGVNTSAMAWAINNGNTYMSWDQVKTAESGATVTGADVIADGDQTGGATDQITGLTFGDIEFN
jgi:hypothetical protein